MKEAASVKPKRRRLGLAGLLLGGAAVVIIGGGGAVATGYASGAFYTIPHTTNRPVDPTTPADYDQKTNNQLEPTEASLGQLWALANSEVGDTPTPGSTAGVGLTDFAAAVTARCYPLLTEAATAELDQLKNGYETSTGPEAAEPAHTYFVRATALCM